MKKRSRIENVRLVIALVVLFLYFLNCYIVFAFFKEYIEQLSRIDLSAPIKELKLSISDSQLNVLLMAMFYIFCVHVISFIYWVGGMIVPEPIAREISKKQ